MAAVVRRLCPAFGQGDELVAHRDERHPRLAAAQLEVEDAPVELERRLEVAHLEGDVVDPDEPRTGHRVALRATRGPTSGGHVAASGTPSHAQHASGAGAGAAPRVLRRGSGLRRACRTSRTRSAVAASSWSREALICSEREG